MTILIDPTKAAALATAGTSNNPLIFWENDALSATYATATGAEVESAANAQTGTTYDAWICTPTVGQTATMTITFPTPVTLNAMAVAAHNIADIGGQLRFEYFTTSWQTIESFSPTDNQAVVAYFDDITAVQWRIRVRLITQNVEIGVAFAGTVMTLPRRIYQGFTSPITPNNVILQSNVSQGGNLLGNLVARRGSSLDAQLTNIDPAFIRGTDFKGFLKHHNDGKGFFWAWRPTKYGDLFYAWREGETINPTNSGPRDLMSFNMGLRCYDDA